LKIRKKQAIAVSFIVGSLLFATTAFAEISSRSGYDQLKDALKNTAESCTSKLSSYTADISIVMKDNGNIISQRNSWSKYDVAKKAIESKSTAVNEGRTDEGYSYSDNEESISYNKEQNSYFVYKFENKNNISSFTNPFKDKRASDMEKIADAVIGSLKDSVVVTENSDGTKQLSGSVSEAQIPAIANALVSYMLKSRYGSPYMITRVTRGAQMPKIVDDIYVKEVKGNMTLNKDGLIESAMGTGVLSGKDEQGVEHAIDFELLVKISDINKTAVNKPDLTGKKVVYRVQKDYTRISKPQMYIGTYKNDIVIEKDGKFQKIGERIVDITGLDDKNVTGRYHEEYLKGNEEYASGARDFKFVSRFQDALNSIFEITDASGSKITGNLWIDTNLPRIGFSINQETKQNLLNTGEYYMVFN
jgi:hypothetical protein